MDPSETTEIGCTRRLRRIALIAMINLTIRALLTLATYVIAFVILSPMLGGPRRPGVVARRQVHHGVEQIPTSLGE